MSGTTPLPPEEYRWKCDESSLGFETTEEITPLAGIIGQERALKSMNFGLGLAKSGYNIYVLGEGGTGKITTVKTLIEEKAAREDCPGDWCYIFNFKDPDKPSSLALSPGKGKAFKSDMERAVLSIRRDIPKVFESRDYEKHRDEILDGQQERTKDIFYKLELTAQETGFLLKKGARGLAVIPARDGKALKQEDYDALPRTEREEIDEKTRQLQERLSDAIRDAKKVEKEAKERIKDLDQEMVQYIINPLVDDLKEKYKDSEQIIDYLSAVREDIFANIDDFRGKEEEVSIPGLSLPTREPSFERYAVNLLVDNSETKGAPVIIETNPTFYNLFGNIEHRVQYGVALTDFTMIRGGAAHRASGGYLVLQALDVLRNIFVYDAIKRMIKNREVKIEDAWEQYRLVSATSLKPEPIPVSIKIVLVGEPHLYYLLHNLDPEYKKFFKVKADFDSEMPRSDEVVMRYAAFISTRCKDEGLMPFDRSAVARVVELGVRFAGQKDKLTARFLDIANIVDEANYWASRDGAERVSGKHVEEAHRERRYRNSKIEDKMQEYIVEDTIMVDIEGSVVGQVNGLAVMSLGDHSFGKPSRVTAKTFLGDSGVVNIEREVKMSGRIHNKALMILSSFLGERYAQKVPLTLSASVCFEQLYGEIEGDSATCTELYALLSSISGLPLAQGISVTGSMNQRGEVQPIGGVNEKIEGFFDVCKEKGLTGSQGVIIPRRNVRNLMLKEEIVEAARDGKFTIYPIDMVDEGLSILTGKEVGELNSDGAYAKDTVNHLVIERLKKLATNYKTFARPKGGGSKKPKKDANSEGTASKEG